ncbi:[acyl-carrier-protein] S-malonyltransferase [candidate division KSB1 bacterium]|nr:MAG: [acyl-carrier-protein] S-malonyltransferase [candidate division KSB1 bacterium]
MKLALIFPGQASQYVGMGKDLCERYPLANEFYDKASDVLEFDLKQISFQGPEEELKQTRITQPAIFVHSVIVAHLLAERGVRPAIVAGHSLGEYSALVGAQAISFEDGLQLVKLRGELMQQAGNRNPGTMAAILGLKTEQVTAICREAEDAGVVVPANFNSPEQVVISGSITGVHKAMELAKTKGAKRVVELVVSGAFHSPLMIPARDQLGQALAKIKIQKPSCPVVPNVTAEPTEDVEVIRRCLVEQLTSPVQWVDSMRTVINFGVEKFLEVGPGKVLCGLLRRIDRQAVCETVGTVEEIENIHN